jgi:hypothetical protein
LWQGGRNFFACQFALNEMHGYRKAIAGQSAVIIDVRQIPIINDQYHIIYPYIRTTVLTKLAPTCHLADLTAA